MSQIDEDMSTITAIVLGSGYPSATGPWSRICAFVAENSALKNIEARTKTQSDAISAPCKEAQEYGSN